MKKRINRHPDHAKRHNTPSPNNQVIAAHLEELLIPILCKDALNKTVSVSDTFVGN
ncbi:hypothetical protein [[Phormidium ambiguum] IAM M-71]|uniref:hypothetical protein n=1 Tax=[Phormidium ambiguum] IAM M-71 TaxID=454136 RepID=UPI0015BBC381|nr:hypothetical protein [Phormidium ambiguum]